MDSQFVFFAVMDGKGCSDGLLKHFLDRREDQLEQAVEVQLRDYSAIEIQQQFRPRCVKVSAIECKALAHRPQLIVHLCCLLSLGHTRSQRENYKLPASTSPKRRSCRGSSLKSSDSLRARRLIWRPRA